MWKAKDIVSERYNNWVFMAVAIALDLQRHIDGCKTFGSEVQNG